MQCLFPDGGGEDRLVFEALRKNFSWRDSGEATCFCTLNEAAVSDSHHVTEFRRRNLAWPEDRRVLAEVDRHLSAARSALAAGCPSAAAQSCDAALRLHPQAVAVLRIAALAYGGAGRSHEARLAAEAAGLMAFGTDESEAGAPFRPERAGMAALSWPRRARRQGHADNPA